MIGFDEAWDTLGIGARVRVSNGSPRPGGTGVGFKVWKSHNFEGTIEQFSDGPPRAIKVEQDEADGATVAYWVSEASGDRFETV